MITWIAGAPHNGSTLLRQILKQCFDFVTYSKYIEEELDFLFPDGVAFTRLYQENEIVRLQWLCGQSENTIIKTHELPLNDAPAIFVVRDGRDAVSALSHFYKTPIRYAITGQHISFPTWSDYYWGWNPEDRLNTILVRFEDMVNRPDEVAEKQLAPFFRQEVKAKYVDDFQECQEKWPRLFNNRIGGWKKAMSESDLDLFWKCHGPLMRHLGYE